MDRSTDHLRKLRATLGTKPETAAKETKTAAAKAKKAELANLSAEELLDKLDLGEL